MSCCRPTALLGRMSPRCSPLCSGSAPPLDLIPRVLTADEWRVIKRGLAQRIRALNAFVDDVYHEHEIVRAGIVPWSLVVSRPSFARPVHGVRAPGGVH